jgi:hypothetical protein
LKFIFFLISRESFVPTPNPIAQWRKPTEIVGHSAFLIENFQFSTQEFYSRVEAALQQRDVPKLQTARVDWHEGGIMSAAREYLRTNYERLTFDICAAPFGTGFFVSFWIGERPPKLGPPALIVLGLMVFCLLDSVIWFPFGPYRLLGAMGFGWFACSFLLIIGFIAGSVMALRTDLITQEDVDAIFMRIPVVSTIYERYFRTITFYRIDMLEMYQQAVHNAVMQVADEITVSKGITPPSQSVPKPVLKDLWCRR